MGNKINIQDEIEKTLISLDNIQKQKAKPFLHTRIQAKMEQYATPSFLNSLFEMPLLKPVFLGAIILINAITILHMNQLPTSTLNTEQTSLEVFTEEYAFNLSSDYLLTIETEQDGN